MTPSEREVLVEEVVSAWRPRDPRGGVRPSAAFYDLDPADRQAAFEAAAVQRELEAALDPDGLSGTAKRVLALLEGR